MNETLAALQIQMLKLQEQYNTTKASLRKAAVVEIKEAIKIFGITASELGLTVAKTTRGKATPRYFDPQSGASWSGRGRMHNAFAKLIAAGANLEDYRL